MITLLQPVSKNTYNCKVLLMQCDRILLLQEEVVSTEQLIFLHLLPVSAWPPHLSRRCLLCTLGAVLSLNQFRRSVGEKYKDRKVNTILDILRGETSFGDICFSESSLKPLEPWLPSPPERPAHVFCCCAALCQPIHLPLLFLFFIFIK